jgi:hypothetical protein
MSSAAVFSEKMPTLGPHKHGFSPEQIDALNFVGCISVNAALWWMKSLYESTKTMKIWVCHTQVDSQ